MRVQKLAFKNGKIRFVTPFVVSLFMLVFLFITTKSDTKYTPTDNTTKQKVLPTSTPAPLPQSYTIPMKKHVFQTFNNCGPATLSMALSYLKIDKSQEELGNILRPYQVPGGDNDDKSVTLNEVADYANQNGLYAYLRPNGNIETIKKFVSNGIPVITRTWLTPNEDIGHYRVVRGFDDSLQTIIQDDSYQNKNLTYSYDDFSNLWKPFNYEYLVIVDKTKKELTEKLLGEEFDEKKAWHNALKRIENEMENDPKNVHLTFAKSRIFYYLGDYEKSVEEFDKVENLLSFRTLWYQIEPVQAIYKTGDYERLFSLSDKILNNQNRAFSELYVLRAKSHINNGNKDLAKTELENAIYYNRNLEEANTLLSNI